MNGGVRRKQGLGSGGNRFGVNRIQRARARSHVSSPANLFLQYDSGTKEFVLDGPEGHFLDQGDLLIGQPREVPQGDELPKVGRKLLDRPMDGPPPLRVPELSVGVEPVRTLLDRKRRRTPRRGRAISRGTVLGRRFRR